MTKLTQLSQELEALNAKLKTLKYGTLEQRTVYRQRNSVLVKLRKLKADEQAELF